MANCSSVATVRRVLQYRVAWEVVEQEAQWWARRQLGQMVSEFEVEGSWKMLRWQLAQWGWYLDGVSEGCYR
jgi:hypothetical protein